LLLVIDEIERFFVETHTADGSVLWMEEQDLRGLLSPDVDIDALDRRRRTK